MKKAIIIIGFLSSCYVNAQTNVFPSTGRAGINTLSPQASIQVRGGARIGTTTNYVNIDSATGSLSFAGTAGYQVANNQFAFSAAKSPSAGLYFNAKDLRYEFRSTTGISNLNIGADALGRIGIGNVSPAAKLDIAGNIKIADGTQGLGKVLTSDGDGLANWQVPAASGWTVNGTDVYNSVSGRVGINTQAPGSTLDVRGTASEDNAAITLTNYNFNHVLALNSGIPGNPGPSIGWLSEDTFQMITSGGSRVLSLQDGLLTANGNLNLNGSIKIVDGSQGAGKVLTSDGNGLASWQQMGTQASGWSLTGNSGTNPATNFIGTTDLKELRFRTNNTEKMRIDTGGNVGIGTSAPLILIDAKAKQTIGTSATSVQQHDVSNRGTKVSFGAVVNTALTEFAGMSIAVNPGTNGGGNSGDILFNTWEYKTSVSRPVMRVLGSGNVVIGQNTAASGAKLTVAGSIVCTELKVQALPFPDYVFDKSYKLRSIKEVENHINTYKRLPGMPSASEVETNGMDVGKMQTKIVEKVEENMLYIIQLSNENEALKKQLDAQAKAIAILQAQIASLNK